MTDKTVKRQHTAAEHDMVSVRQGRHGAWLIDTPPRMVSLTTDSPQRNATVITPAWPSVSESVHTPYSEWASGLLFSAS